MLEDLIKILIEATDHDSVRWVSHPSNEFSASVKGHVIISSQSRLLLREGEDSFDLPPSIALQEAISRQLSRKPK